MKSKAALPDWQPSFALISVLGLFFLVGCGDQSQDLDERVTQLQKELDRSQTDLEAARAELARLKGNPASVAPALAPAPVSSRPELPSQDVLERTYTADAKALKQQVQERLKGFSLEKCTLHRIDTPSDQYPITSSMSLSIRGDGGKSFQLDLPVKADRKGNWVLPSADEIVARIVEIGRSTTLANALNEEANVTARSQTSQSPSGPGLSANRTVVIRWPDSGSSAPRNESNAAPPPPEQPPPTSTNRQQQSTGPGLSANRTVVIQWPDSGSASSATNPPGGGARRNSSGQPTTATPDRDVLVQF